MDNVEALKAIILGVIEGVTEFLPVSSTGHLIVASELLGFDGPPGFVFEVAIQLGAILAVCFKYWRRIMVVTLTLHSRPASRRFAGTILLAFLPAMVIGAIMHDAIKEYLFRPLIVGITMVLGGILIIVIENSFKLVRFETVDHIPYRTALKIGFFQTLAMVPGVSRSGATIMGALMLGVSREAAAEFSFFLAIPTMFAATVYDLYKNWHELQLNSLFLIALGFVVSFFSAWLVVNKLINFISKHGFKGFAYYRIVVGLGILFTIFLK